MDPRQALLINTVGYACGSLVFALSLYFLLGASWRGRRPASRLSLAAASLALVWNLASLAALACREFGWPGEALAVALSTSALSALPAVLLHLALGARERWAVRAGYALAAAVGAMHATENLLPAWWTHQHVFLVTTAGFGGLTLAAAGRALAGRQLIGSMAMFLFAVSLAHAGAGDHSSGGLLEILAHHGGIALALIVLLQDVRFVLLDSFVRVLANLALAGAFVFLAWKWGEAALAAAGQSPVLRGVGWVALLLLLWLYSEVRQRLQGLLTRLAFGRHDRERLHATGADEASYFDAASAEAAAMLRASLVPESPALTAGLALESPALVSELAPAALRDRLAAAGVEAVAPVRMPAGECRFLLLGYRAGGRRWLSEDLLAAERLAAHISERVATIRAAELRRLVTQAELRALESQIQPHFLFNVLNTLYGLIPRQAEAARSTVLNLADLLRYHLKQDRTFIPLEEEMRTVEAYLAIEKLRLGDRLRVRVEMDPTVRAVSIPVLSLEPLVENAVKHAVAARAEGGEVVVKALREGAGLRVRVEDSGPGFAGGAGTGGGVGLANVRRRLELCYGAAGGGLEVHSTAQGSVVEFLVPLQPGHREVAA